MSKFTAILNDLMLENNITKAELSRQISIHKTTIGNWFRLDTEPSNDMLVRVANYFHVSTDYLLGRDEYTTGLTNTVNSLDKYQLELVDLFSKLNRDNQIRYLGYGEMLLKSQSITS